MILSSTSAMGLRLIMAELDQGVEDGPSLAAIDGLSRECYALAQRCSLTRNEQSRRRI